jgi:hypothetical protein
MIHCVVKAACQSAAREICETYEIASPRGRSFANSPEVTIAIIIEQAILAALSSALPDTEGK